ncbi:MAG: hypothetical protein QOE68_2027, partial [Thermoanaerobaculia bacterium]|nr:hypothetical protein [Thermoanaerobaculia bacterium]
MNLGIPFASAISSHPLKNDSPPYNPRILSFSRKYVLWLLVPPAVVIGPLSYVFLSQVVRMSFEAAEAIVGLFALFFFLGATATWFGLIPLADAVDEDVRRGRDASDAASRCLARTESLTLVLWGAGSILFAIVAALLVMPSVLGFGYFLVAALIGAFPSVIWAYAIGKRLLAEHASHGGALRYTGRRFALGRKIGIVFI